MVGANFDLAGKMGMVRLGRCYPALISGQTVSVPTQGRPTIEDLDFTAK
jgi:hypothetical protein